MRRWCLNETLKEFDNSKREKLVPGRMKSMCKGSRLSRTRPVLRIANSPVCLESDEERRGRGR